jgi:DNA-binding NarL/FixJ family response regulator
MADSAAMTNRVPTYIYANDPISLAGVTAQLRMRTEIRLVEAADVDSAEVAVVVTRILDEETLRVMRALRRGTQPRTVLVADVIDDQALVAAAEAGVCGLLRRSDATAEALARSIMSVAAGDGDVPADLIARLLTQLGRLQRHVLTPRGLTFSGLTERETEVFRMVADGLDTADIARQLSYSERTVKNIVHAVTTRLQLKNRSHAVAYVLREGLI